MRVLLDTHTFLWFISGSLDLSQTARKIIENPENEQILSVGSLWEMAIKTSLGKLKIEMPFTQLVEREVEGNGISMLNVQSAHLDELAALPFHHKDPFDRLIIAQGMAEGIPIISRDSAFGLYSIETIW